MDSVFDFDKLAQAPVQHEPYSWLIVPGFLKEQHIDSIERDYPEVTQPGSFPLPSLSYGGAFAQMCAELQAAPLAKMIGDKLGLDVTHKPTTITVRGQCRATDGQIHTDSKSKLITVLLYMNGQWEAKGGQLRLLRSANNLQDYFAEVPPMRGTLLAFKNAPHAWHGHESFSGQRRVLQLNWVSSDFVVWKESLRHRISAFFKTRNAA